MSPRKVTTKKSKSLDLPTLANDALVALKHIASGIPLEDVSPEQAMAARSANIVPDEAITIAIAVMEADPKRFSAFDPQAVRSAVKYEQAMSPLATQVSSLGQQITKNVQKQRGIAAGQTLGLYLMLKGLSRVSLSEATRSQQHEMGKLFTTHKKRRATSVTKKEATVAVQSVKATKVAAAKAAIAAAANADAAEAATAAGIAAPVSPTVAAPAAATPATPVVTTGPATVVAGH